MSELVNGFVRACKERGLTEDQTKTAAARAVQLHPELREEFEKAAALPIFLAATAASLAAPWLIDKFSGKGKAEAAPGAAPVDNSWKREEIPTPTVTSGAPAQNLYSNPGQGGMAPRFWPSMAMPPGGFPGYGPTGAPGSPFGRSPFQHTVLPPMMPKMSSADMEKDAIIGAALAAGRALLPRLANSFAGRATAGGLVRAGHATGVQGLATAGKAVGRTGAQRATQVAGQATAQQKKLQALMATGKFATPAEATAHLANSGGVLRNAQNSLNVHGTFNNANSAFQAAAPKPGFLRQNAVGLGITGAAMTPMFMGGGGEMPPPQQGMETQAAFRFPPTIGVEKEAVLGPGGLDTLPVPPPGAVPPPNVMPSPTKPGKAKPKAKPASWSPTPITPPAAAAPLPLPPPSPPLTGPGSASQPFDIDPPKKSLGSRAKGFGGRIGGGLARGGMQAGAGLAVGSGLGYILKNMLEPYQAEAAPKLGPNPFAKASSAVLPGGAEDMRDLPSAPPRAYERPQPSKWKGTAKRVGLYGGAALAGAATAHGINKLLSPKKEKKAAVNPFA